MTNRTRQRTGESGVCQNRDGDVRVFCELPQRIEPVCIYVEEERRRTCIDESLRLFRVTW